MSTTTVQFNCQFTEGSAFFDPDGDSVTIIAPGVVRTDTGGVVVAGSIAMTRISTGIYQIAPFSDPAPNLVYTWSTSFAVNTIPVISPGTTIGGTSAATGYYTSQSAMEARFGTENVDQASALAGQDGADATVMQDALNDVDNYINFRAYAYKLPAPIPIAATYFATLADRACDLGYPVIYSRRGQFDTDNKTMNGKMGALMKSAKDGIEDILFQAARFLYASNPGFGVNPLLASCLPSGPPPYTPRPWWNWGWGFGWGGIGW